MTPTPNKLKKLAAVMEECGIEFDLDVGKYGEPIIRIIVHADTAGLFSHDFFEIGQDFDHTDITKLTEELDDE